jgi:hypothetical protein
LQTTKDTLQAANDSLANTKDELPKTTALSNYQRQVFTCTKDKHHGASNRHGVYLMLYK